MAGQQETYMNKRPILQRIAEYLEYCRIIHMEPARILVHPDDYPACPSHYEGLPVVTFSEGGRTANYFKENRDFLEQVSRSSLDTQPTNWAARKTLRKSLRKE